MRKIYFTRHGETFLNLEARFCGHADTLLTPVGHEQGKALGEKIRTANLPIDLILHSPLQRAKQTASYISEATGIPMREEPRLIERNFGKYEGLHYADVDFHGCKTWIADSLGGGETLLHLAHRIYGLLDELTKDSENKTYLLVAHNGVARIVNTYFHDMSNEAFANFSLHNCEIVEYTFSEQ